MKKIIYTGILVAAGILLIVVLVLSLSKEKEVTEGSVNLPDKANRQNVLSTESDTVSADAIEKYIPGIYTTELLLGSQSVEVEVIVDACNISSIRIANLDDAVQTMYPLLQSAYDALCEQILEKQSVEGVTYSAESRYTSLVLLEAIENSLNKAKIEVPITDYQ